jgi:hypothetical protein
MESEEWTIHMATMSAAVEDEGEEEEEGEGGRGRGSWRFSIFEIQSFLPTFKSPKKEKSDDDATARCMMKNTKREEKKWFEPSVSSAFTLQNISEENFCKNWRNGHDFNIRETNQLRRGGRQWDATKYTNWYLLIKWRNILQENRKGISN